jgi:predicted aspartyl protease
MISGGVDKELVPFVHLKARSGGLWERVRGTETEVDFLVDTGYTGSFPLAMPEDLLLGIGAKPFAVGKIRFADGTIRTTNIYCLEILWGSAWRACSVAALPVGRDDPCGAPNNLMGTRMLLGCRLHMDVRDRGNVTIQWDD